MPPYGLPGAAVFVAGICGYQREWSAISPVEFAKGVAQSQTFDCWLIAGFSEEMYQAQQPCMKLSCK